MYIPNDDIQNYPFCRLPLVVETIGQSQLNEPFNQNSIKIRKCYNNTLGTSEINSPFFWGLLIDNTGTHSLINTLL